MSVTVNVLSESRVVNQRSLYTKIKRTFHDDFRRLGERSLNIHMSLVNFEKIKKNLGLLWQIEDVRFCHGLTLGHFETNFNSVYYLTFR